MAVGHSIKLTGECLLEDTFIDLCRVVVIKKGVSQAARDRIVKFVGAYVIHLNLKGAWWLSMCGASYIVRRPRDKEGRRQ